MQSSETIHGLHLFEGSSHLNTPIIVGLSSTEMTEDDPDLDLVEINETDKSCDKADSVEHSSASEKNTKCPSC